MLQFEIKSYDRKPRRSFRRRRSGTKAGPADHHPAGRRVDGDLIWPHQKTNRKPVRSKRMPSYTIRLVKAVLGEEAYGRLAKAGKSASDIETVCEVAIEIAAWRTTDLEKWIRRHGSGGSSRGR